MGIERLIERFTSRPGFSTYGDSGVESMNELAKAIGYNGHSFRYGSPIEEFLSDNPGAMEAIRNWISEAGVPEWEDSLKGVLGPEDDEEEEDNLESERRTENFYHEDEEKTGGNF